MKLFRYLMASFGILLCSVVGGKNKTPTKSPYIPTTPPNKICQIWIPDDPLSPEGLATPFKMKNCQMNQDEACFAQAVVFDSDQQQFFAYTPLIIPDSSQSIPMMDPPLFNPDVSVVGLWFGSNDFSIQLENDVGILNGNCVDGLGQFASCNGDVFFEKVNMDYNMSLMPIHQLANDGLACPTSRSFYIVDADPSDNLPVSYLSINPINGNYGGSSPPIIVKDTIENREIYKNMFTVLMNPSDEALLNFYILPAMGCESWLIESLDSVANPALTPTLATNEIFAAFYEKNPALIPANDPFVLDDNGNPSLAKLNTMRAMLNQNIVTYLDEASTMIYCGEMLMDGLKRILMNKSNLMGFMTPNVKDAANLYLFLLFRFSESFDTLNCGKLLNVTNPIKLTTVNGCVVAATINYSYP